MFTIQEDRESGRQRKHHREFEAVVRLTHEKMLADKTGAAEVGIEPSHRQTWDEMVFENRNREYGAFAVRKGYNGNVVIGLAATLIIVMIVILSPALAKLFGKNDVHEQVPPRKLVYTELSAPPPIDKPKPPPPQVLLPRLQKIIKFVPPRVVKEEVRDVMPTVEEIKVNDTGSEQIEGPAQVIFDEPVAEVVVEADDELFTVVDQQPEYAGGYEAMMAFIKANMQYPANARRMRIEGTVHVSFIVSKTGQISDVKILRGIMAECDREAIRVVQMMPAWIPGKQNGRPVNVRFILPLKFRLS